MRPRTSSRPVAIMAAKRTGLSGELCSSLPTLLEIKGLSDVKFDNPNWDPPVPGHTHDPSQDHQQFRALSSPPSPLVGVPVLQLMSASDK